MVGGGLTPAPAMPASLEVDAGGGNVQFAGSNMMSVRFGSVPRLDF